MKQKNFQLFDKSLRSVHSLHGKAISPILFRMLAYGYTVMRETPISLSTLFPSAFIDLFIVSSMDERKHLSTNAPVLETDPTNKRVNEKQINESDFGSCI